MTMNLFQYTEKSKENSINTGFGPIKGMSKFSSVLTRKSTEIVRKKNITKPYQFLGVWIAQNLNEFEHLPLYIRLAKYQDRALLEQAVSYTKDYPEAKSKHKIFLWYLKGKMKKMSLEVKKKKKVKVKEATLF